MKDMEAFVLTVEKERALWREFDDKTKELKQVAKHDPAGFAAAVVQNTVRQLLELSDKLSPVLGVDLIALRMADGEARWQVGNIDVRDYFHMVSDLTTFQALWRVFEYSQREDATPEGLTQEFFKAREGYPGRHAFTIHVVRHEVRRAGKAWLVPDTMLAESLAALVSARTKLPGVNDSLASLGNGSLERAAKARKTSVGDCTTNCLRRLSRCFMSLWKIAWTRSSRF